MRLGSILHVLGRCIFGLLLFVLLELVCGILDRGVVLSSVSEQCVCGLTHNGLLAHHSPCCACLLKCKRVFVQISGLRFSQGFWTNFLVCFWFFWVLFCCCLLVGVFLWCFSCQVIGLLGHCWLFFNKSITIIHVLEFPRFLLLSIIYIFTEA